MSNKSLVKLPFPGIKGAYLIYSACRKRIGGSFDERIASNTSFLFYGSSECAAEWEPQYGPIQVWCRRNEGEENSKPHYVFPFVDSNVLNWSQIVVEEEMLKPALLYGDYEYIFRVLKRWARGSGE